MKIRTFRWLWILSAAVISSVSSGCGKQDTSSGSSGGTHDSPKASISASAAILAKQEKTKPWELTAFAFPKKGERLPENYTGINPNEFFALFKSKADGIPKKGEHETSEEYAKRTADLGTFFAPINKSDLYAFNNLGGVVEYNPDEECYNIRIYTMPSNLWGNGKWAIYSVAASDILHIEGVGTNAFGAKSDISVDKATFFALTVKKSNPVLSNPVWTNEYDFKLRLPVALDKARLMETSHIRILFVGNVLLVGKASEKKYIEGVSGMNPTRDSPKGYSVRLVAIPFNPKSIIVYYENTGEILYQLNF